MIRKPSIVIVLIAFLLSCVNPLYAGSLFLNLPSPGSPVWTSPAFKPLILQGIKIDSKNPLHLDFIIDTGDAAPDAQTLRTETLKLVRYFLASLTVPNDQLWVNLSPYEKNRIIPDGLALTEMGSELLAQDYMLKQLTASLMGPEQSAGKQFWGRIYANANEKYGSSQIPLDIFNKVWIVPDKATIFEHKGTAVIVESHLKVMLEQDYLALEKNHQKVQNRGSMASALIREVVLPQIEREVNEGRNFAGVRQVNNALILAAWFKQNLKQSLLGQIYANRNKVSGIDLQDRTVKQKIYAQYLKAFKKGVYNYIKEDIDPRTQEVVARKYFLGGYNARNLRLVDQEASPAQISASISGHDLLASVDLAMLTDKAAAAENAARERLNEIKDDYKGFPVVKEDRDIPTGVQYALAFYDLQPGGPENNPLRALIRAGKLRAGPDLTGAIKAIRNGDEIIVSTDSETEADRELIQLLTPELVEGFTSWKRNINSERIRSLALHTSGVIAKPMEVLKRYGILDLLSKEPVQMREIIKHVRELKVDGETIKYNTPNTQYIFAVLRALESLGWLTSKGKSASKKREFTLTPKGMQAIQYVGHYTQVADFMPEFTKIADYLFNRKNPPRLKEGVLNLKKLADLSKKGWDIPETVDAPLAELIKGQLDGYLVINLSLALWKEGVFNLFNDEGEINIDNIVREKNIKGDHDELKATFDIFVNVGFLSDLGEDKYKMTPEGLVAFDKVLNYGVPVSYRPTYDLVEQLMFGDAKAIKRYDDKGRELLVYRWLNVLGSGASHAPYFRQIDKNIETMIGERLKNGEIPAPEQLSGENPFVLSFADTGSGDGTYLDHVYHVIMKTGYWQRMIDHPDLYKIEMVGVDYNPEAQFATKQRLESKKIPNTVMFGDISDPKQIVRDVKTALFSKYGQNARLMVIHTRTFLDHNRPWKGVKYVRMAQNRISHSTGTYGWRGKAIPNNYFEQNLFEHFKAWFDALRAEGQKDIYIIELHTIDPKVAAANIGRTLTGPYDLSHYLTDQMPTENSVYQARAKEAGFVGISHKLIPDGPLTTVSIDHWGIPAMNKAMVVTSRPAVNPLSPFGGINLNPDLGFVRVERDARGAELPIEISILQNINIDGIQPVLLKIVSLNSQQLLDE